MLFFVSLALVKVSIVLFNRRLTGLTSRRWQIAHWTFLGILFVYILVVIFRSCFNCYPPSMDWGLRGRGEPSTAPQCSDDVKSILGYSAVHIALDWALLAGKNPCLIAVNGLLNINQSVPLIVLYKIEKMSLSKKIRIGMLFSIGLVACIGSAMRQYMQNHSYKDRVCTSSLSLSQHIALGFKMKKLKPLDHYPEQLKWTIVDIFFGTIVASMPVLNALIPRRWRKADGHILPDSLTIFRSSRGSKGKGAVSLDSESTGGNSQHSALSQQATKDQKSSANVANETQFQMEDVDGEADNTRKEPMYDGSDRAPRPTPREGFSRSPYGPADFA